MFEGEIIFYNGFNLLVDVIIFAITAWVFSRISWRNGWRIGYQDGLSEGYGRATMDIDDGILIKEYCPVDQKQLWTIKAPQNATVHQLFATREAE